VHARYLFSISDMKNQQQRNKLNDDLSCSLTSPATPQLYGPQTWLTALASELKIELSSSEVLEVKEKIDLEWLLNHGKTLFLHLIFAVLAPAVLTRPGTLSGKDYNPKSCGAFIGFMDALTKALDEATNPAELDLLRLIQNKLMTGKGIEFYAMALLRTSPIQSKRRNAFAAKAMAALLKKLNCRHRILGAHFTANIVFVLAAGGLVVISKCGPAPDWFLKPFREAGAENEVLFLDQYDYENHGGEHWEASIMSDDPFASFRRASTEEIASVIF
jgi:hypothetical protein